MCRVHDYMYIYRKLGKDLSEFEWFQTDCVVYMYMRKL